MKTTWTLDDLEGLPDGARVGGAETAVLSALSTAFQPLRPAVRSTPCRGELGSEEEDRTLILQVSEPPYLRMQCQVNAERRRLVGDQRDQRVARAPRTATLVWGIRVFLRSD